MGGEYVAKCLGIVLDYVQGNNLFEFRVAWRAPKQAVHGWHVHADTCLPTAEFDIRDRGLQRHQPCQLHCLPDCHIRCKPNSALVRPAGVVVKSQDAPEDGNLSKNLARDTKHADLVGADDLVNHAIRELERLPCSPHQSNRPCYRLPGFQNGFHLAD